MLYCIIGNGESVVETIDYTAGKIEKEKEYDIEVRETLVSNKSDDINYDVEFMTVIIDKADNMKIIDSDSHFAEFSGVHPSKIKQGKLTLHEILKPIDRERVMKAICKESARFVYIDFDILDENDKPVFVHCIGQNSETSSICRLTMADVSKGRARQERLQAKATEMNSLIDLVNGGVCLFKVSQNMHIEALYLNEGCCKMFGTSKGNYKDTAYRLDELIHPDDRSDVFQAIGKTMAVGDPIYMECRVMTHHNQPIWCVMSAGIQRYDDDGCPVFHAIFTDISRIKQAEKKADDEADKLVCLFKNLPGAVFFTASDKPLNASIVSEDFIRLTGYTRTEFFDFFGGNIAKIIDDDDVKRVEQSLIKQAKTENIISETYTIHTANHGDISVNDNRNVIFHDDGTSVTVGVLTKT